jgi:hypothetical protein
MILSICDVSWTINLYGALILRIQGLWSFGGVSEAEYKE